MSRPGGFREHGGARPEPPRRSRLEKPALAPEVTTLWEYPSQHYGTGMQGDARYKGATPSFVIWNVVHRFTHEGDLVVDPFCGSGTTLDVCADLGRRARGFDVAPARDDVENADARSLPLKDGAARLVFMDPPYADNLDYSDDPRCIGKLKAQGQYERAMRLALKEAHRVLGTGGTLAIYVCDVFKKGKPFAALGFSLFSLATDVGFSPIDVVAVVRHNRTLAMGNYRKAADEGGFYLRGFNYLLLLEKAAPRANKPSSDAADASEPPARAERTQRTEHARRAGRGTPDGVSGAPAERRRPSR